MPHQPIFALLLACTLLAACGRQPPATAPGSPPVASDQSAARVGTGMPGSFAFDEASIADLQARMAAGGLSSHALTQAYL
jgi:amidase